jgi:probable F420-dependent oxidoreductase
MLYGLTIFATDYSMAPADVARAAEDRGFESLLLPEHTHMPVHRKNPWPGGPVMPKEYSYTFDPFVSLSAAATATRELKVGTSICLVIQRDPIITAKEVATLDRLSGGRFIFGIGGGWNLEEVENHGTRFSRRFSILRERILAMRELWTQEEAEFHGRYVDFDKVLSYPKPVQKPHPPIIMGGDAPTTFDRVIEFCDGWMPIGRGVAPPGLREKIADLRRRAEAAGRDPRSISVTLYQSPADRQVIDDLERAGVDRVVFRLPSAEPAEVLPAMDEYAKLIS